MAIETEKKYRLNENQRQTVLKNLEEMKAEFVGEDFEENTIYYGGVLTEVGGILRIRKIEDKNLLTYKKRIKNNFNIKQQIEHETEISHPEAVEKIIESLGIPKALIYEKRRKTWHLKNVEVLLDELPFGFFMEIEGEILDISEAEMLLDIEDYETEHLTYPALTYELGKKVGEVIEARFEKE